jgi:hypothetical protein
MVYFVVIRKRIVPWVCVEEEIVILKCVEGIDAQIMENAQETPAASFSVSAMKVSVVVSVTKEKTVTEKLMNAVFAMAMANLVTGTAN